jgi:formylglycine-generating enzyme required for sulfatase activity
MLLCGCRSGLRETITREQDGMPMVFVPAGTFEMGDDSDARSRPEHTVQVDGFWIDQTEITNAQLPEDNATLYVAHGGSWFDEPEDMQSSHQKALTTSSYRMHWVGLRCVIDH